MEMEQAEITLNEHEFRIGVVKSLARLETLAQSTDAHLKRLNGSVARHEEKIALLQQGMASDHAAQKATAAWWRRVAPLVWVFVGCILALLALNGPKLAKLVLQP
jgi:hypothetical protein